MIERVEASWRVADAAAVAGVSVRTAAKWRARVRSEGEQGQLDRSSRPRRQLRRTPLDRVEAVLRLRRLRMTAAEIPEVLRMALSRCLGSDSARVGAAWPARARAAGPLRTNAAGRARPPDVKRLGRIQGGAGKRDRGGLRKHHNPARIDAKGKRRLAVGWEFVHVCVDDYSRLAFV